MSAKKLPPFRKVSQSTTLASPEEVFFSLTRASSHGYLRGQQQDVLREYAGSGADKTDVAFELPTGTGKTTVGLLLAERRRRSGDRVAYLCLTNQLAAQVIVEAGKLGVSVADVRGDKYTRNPAEEGKFRTGTAVAVSTYSNLFNINPVIKDCGLVVFDDAHGGEQYASDMWTVTVDKNDHPDVYSGLLAALRPALSPAQFTEVTESEDYTTVQLADSVGHPECAPAVRAILDAEKEFEFRWQQIRPKLSVCLFLVSPAEISIRPLIPPTHAHAPFANIGQRVYLSATLGGRSDLQRAYGVKQMELVRAKSAQWGRRYIFVPGIFTDAEGAFEVAARIWDGLPVRRAVLLAPSRRAADEAFSHLTAKTTSPAQRLGSDDIKDDLAPFTTSTNTMLVLAGRYDGLDLPDEDCRFLVIADSPAATNALERHLTSKWKMGPVVRRRERTRLIQGMGRCTRSATDFAVVLWLGQSLVDIASSKSAVKQMPAELQKELTWGIQQVTSGNLQTIVDMALGLVENRDYRKEANDAIAKCTAAGEEPEEKDETGTDEVKFSVAMWEGDYDFAFQTARSIAEHSNSPSMAGYRGWWWYRASVAARLAGNKDSEVDCLWHSSKSGVYTGFASHLLSARKATKAAASGFAIPLNAEAIWDTLEFWGWAGPTFDERLKTMLSQIKSDEPAKFHQGLELLGKCVGAVALRPSTPGAPDVIWQFSDALCACFEAKTDKKANGVIYKKDLEEAKLHPDWVRHHLKLPTSTECPVLLVSRTAKVDKVAEPFMKPLFYISSDVLRSLAENVARELREVRAKFAGRAFGEAEMQFAAEIAAAKLDFESLKSSLMKTPLSEATKQ